MVADTDQTPTRPIIARTARRSMNDAEDHPQEDAAFMVFVWQFGSVAVFASIVGVLGRRLLPWFGIGTRA